MPLFQIQSAVAEPHSPPFYTSSLTPPGFIHCPDHHVPCAVLFFHHRPRSATHLAFQCHSAFQPPLDRPTVARSVPVSIGSQVSHGDAKYGLEVPISVRSMPYDRFEPPSGALGRTELRSAGSRVVGVTCWPCYHPQRAAPLEAAPFRLHPLLPRRPDPSGPRQANSGRPSSVEVSGDCRFSTLQTYRLPQNALGAQRVFL